MEQLALARHVHPAEIGEGVLHLLDGQQPYPVVQVARDVANGGASAVMGWGLDLA